MIPQDYIAGRGFNSVFSELENYELVQNPTESGFLSETATLKKRDGLFTDKGQGGVYNWQTRGQIGGKIIHGGVAFVWDDECNVYRFIKDDNGEYELSLVYENTDSLVFYDKDRYGRRVKQKAIIIPYLAKRGKSWTANKLLSTNDDGNGNTLLVVNEDDTFDANDVGRYIYFNNDASSQARGQIRMIVGVVDDKTVELYTMFYGEPIDWGEDEPGEVYEEIDDVVVFNNLRTADGKVLAIGVNDLESNFRNLGGLDIEIFEGRYRYINSYGTSVGGSVGSGEFEILDPDTIRGVGMDAKGQKMDSLVLTKNYLLINLENSMSVIWKIADSTDSDPIYNINSIINGNSSFGPDTIDTRGGLYYLAKDRVYEGGDIIAVSSNIIYGETKNQGTIIQKFLNEIDKDTYVRVYNYGRGQIIQYTKGDKTTMMVYDSQYEGWLPWRYSLAIYDKFEPFYEDQLICVGDKVCLKKGNSDLGSDIKVKCVITGSNEFVNSLFSLKKIKMSLGYYGNTVKFKIRVDLGYDVFESKIEKDADGVEYLTWHNIAGQPVGLGGIPLGYQILGGENSLSKSIAKIGLIGIPIGKKCTYYKITFENIDNYDLNIVGITTLVEGGSPYVTPANNIF